MIASLMERFIEISTTWLWLVLLASWRALPILVIVTGIILALRRRLSPSLHALLLTIVLVRLLLPVSIASPLSLHKPIDNWFSIQSAGEAASQPAPIAANYDTHRLLPIVDGADSQGGMFQFEPAQVGPPATMVSWAELLGTILLLIVGSVSIGLLLRSIVSHVRFALKLRSCRLLNEQSLVDLLLRECDSLSVGRRPTVREVPALAAPAVFGVFRKTICLPPKLIETLSHNELRWVIRHELAHIRRWDIPVVIIASLVGAIHWFNPIAWLVVKRLRAAIEAAADHLALQGDKPGDASAYGKLLLRLAENSVTANKSPTLGLISFASGRHLKRRVELLLQEERSTGRHGRLLIASLVAMVAFLGLTDAKEAEKEMPSLNMVAGDMSAIQAQPSWNDPFSFRVDEGSTYEEQYDIESIFESMPQSISDGNRSAKERLSGWLPLSPAIEGKWKVDGKTLSANLTARQHQILAQTLETWRNGEPKQISIEARFIQTNIQTASSIDWAKQRIEGLTVRGLGPALAARINQTELQQLILTASADRKGNILFAPKVAVYDGQTASIASGSERPFITGVDPTPDGRIQPIVSLVDEGLRFLLTPKTGTDDSVSLAFEVKVSSISKVYYAKLPIKTKGDTSLQPTVQVPATELCEISSSVKLRVGESVIVAIPRIFCNERGADAESTTLVALTPSVIPSVVSPQGGEY